MPDCLTAALPTLGIDAGSTSDLPESLRVGDGDAPKKGGIVKNVVLR